MEIWALSILVLFSLIGFAAIFFTTFGTLIILIGSILYAFLTEFSIIQPKVLIIIFVLYLIGEAIEYIAIITGAKKFGASNAAVFGAFIGGVLGAALGAGFLGIGLIFGAFFGIFSGAFLVELIVKRDLIKSLKAGAGSLLGRFGSIVIKVIIAIAMFAIMAVSIARAGDGQKRYSDGKYAGKSAMMKVAVEISGGAIRKIDVTGHDGENEYLDMIGPMINEMVLKQRTDIDAVSGATFSSAGLKEAVDDALKKASGR